MQPNVEAGSEGSQGDDTRDSMHKAEPCIERTEMGCLMAADLTQQPQQPSAQPLFGQAGEEASASGSLPVKPPAAPLLPNEQLSASDLELMAAPSFLRLEGSSLENILGVGASRQLKEAVVGDDSAAAGSASAQGPRFPAAPEAFLQQLTSLDPFPTLESVDLPAFLQEEQAEAGPCTSDPTPPVTTGLEGASGGVPHQLADMELGSSGILGSDAFADILPPLPSVDALSLGSKDSLGSLGSLGSLKLDRFFGRSISLGSRAFLASMDMAGAGQHHQQPPQQQQQQQPVQGAAAPPGAAASALHAAAQLQQAPPPPLLQLQQEGRPAAPLPQQSQEQLGLSSGFLSAPYFTPRGDPQAAAAGAPISTAPFPLPPPRPQPLPASNMPALSQVASQGRGGLGAVGTGGLAAPPSLAAGFRSAVMVAAGAVGSAAALPASALLTTVASGTSVVRGGGGAGGAGAMASAAPRAPPPPSSLPPQGGQSGGEPSLAGRPSAGSISLTRAATGTTAATEITLGSSRGATESTESDQPPPPPPQPRPFPVPSFYIMPPGAEGAALSFPQLTPEGVLALDSVHDWGQLVGQPPPQPPFGGAFPPHAVPLPTNPQGGSASGASLPSGAPSSTPRSHPTPSTATFSEGVGSGSVPASRSGGGTDVGGGSGSLEGGGDGQQLTDKQIRARAAQKRFREKQKARKATMQHDLEAAAQDIEREKAAVEAGRLTNLVYERTLAYREGVLGVLREAKEGEPEARGPAAPAVPTVRALLEGHHVEDVFPLEEMERLGTLEEVCQSAEEGRSGREALVAAVVAELAETVEYLRLYEEDTRVAGGDVLRRVAAQQGSGLATRSVSGALQHMLEAQQAQQDLQQQQQQQQRQDAGVTWEQVLQYAARQDQATRATGQTAVRPSAPPAPATSSGSRTTNVLRGAARTFASTAGVATTTAGAAATTAGAAASSAGTAATAPLRMWGGSPVGSWLESLSPFGARFVVQREVAARASSDVVKALGAMRDGSAQQLDEAERGQLEALLKRMMFTATVRGATPWTIVDQGLLTKEGGEAFYFSKYHLRRITKLLRQAGVRLWRLSLLCPEAVLEFSAVRLDTGAQASQEEQESEQKWDQVLESLRLHPSQMDDIWHLYADYAQQVRPLRQKRRLLVSSLTQVQSRISSRGVASQSDHAQAMLSLGQISQQLVTTARLETVAYITLSAAVFRLMLFPLQKSRFITRSWPLVPQSHLLALAVGRKLGVRPPPLM